MTMVTTTDSITISMNKYFSKADQEQQLLDEYTRYKDQEEQQFILEEVKRYANEYEGYEHESN